MKQPGLLYRCMCVMKRHFSKQQCYPIVHLIGTSGAHELAIQHKHYGLHVSKACLHFQRGGGRGEPTFSILWVVS